MKPIPLVTALFIAVSAAWLTGKWAAISSRQALPDGVPTEMPAETLPAPATAAVDVQKLAQQVLALELPDSAGRTQAVNQWAGKVRVINWWATWCKPCREEMPAFSQLHERYARQGVQFVGLSIDEADAVRDYTKVTPVSYPLLIATPEALALTVGLGNPVQGLPFTLVLDRQGKVVAARLGRYREAELEAVIKTLL